MVVSRRSLLALSAWGAGAALVGCSSPSSVGTAAASGTGTAAASGAGVPVTVGLTYIPNIQFAPFYVAEASGGYAKTGARVTLRHHGGNEGLFTALAAGQEHFVVAGADEMLQARAEGMDLVAVAQYYRTYPVVCIVLDGSPIASASDLKGRTLGIPGRYGETFFGLQVLLKAAGLTESDVKVTEIGYTQQAALTTKKVDAVMGFSNNDVVNFAAAGVGVRTLPLTTAAVPLVGVSLIASRAFLTAQPAVAKQVVDATTAGFAAVLADPDAAVTTSASQITTLASDQAARTAAQKTLQATMPLWKDASGKVDPTLDSAQFATMASFMSAQGLLKSQVDAAQAMSNSFHS